MTENQTTDTPQAQPTPAKLDEVDCVVIGLGAGGAPLLARLAQAGLKVVALEAGPWHNPEKDFATDEKAQDFLFWNDERLATGGNPLAMGRNNSGTGVGGSTLHYTAYTPRPLPKIALEREVVGQG
ncbi:MAG: GMC family oxidoreductase, partial [Cytophagaceae bacterium]